MRKIKLAISCPIVLILIAALAAAARSATDSGNLTFSNTLLVQPNGDSEPAISIGSNGTDAASEDDPTAIWNTYLAQTTDDGASFAQSLVSNTPNHIGMICTEGSNCDMSERTLLDLFEVAINPQDGRAAIAYTDDVLTSDSDGNPLPQIVVAYQDAPSFSSITAVPEPGTALLGATGFSALVLRRRRRPAHRYQMLEIPSPTHAGEQS